MREKKTRKVTEATEKSKFRKSSTEVKAEVNGKKAEVKQDRRKTKDTKNSRF